MSAPEAGPEIAGSLKALRRLFQDEEPDANEVHRLCDELGATARTRGDRPLAEGSRLLAAAAREVAEGRLPWERARGTASDTLDHLWSLVERGEAGPEEAAALDRIGTLTARWRDLGVQPPAEAPGPEDGRATGTATREYGPSTQPASSPSPLRPSADLVASLRPVLEELERALAALQRDPRDLAALRACAERSRAVPRTAEIGDAPDAVQALQALEEAAGEPGPVAPVRLGLLRAARDTLAEVLERVAEPAPIAATLGAAAGAGTAAMALEPEGRAPEDAEGDVPVEVLNFFRSELRARLDFLRGLQAEAVGTPERAQELTTEAEATLDALARTAETFGLPVSARAIEAARSSLARSGLHVLGDDLGALEEHVSRELGVPLDAGRTSLEGTGAPPSAARAAHPVSAPEPPEVPIEELCYRGDGALRRALELRRPLEEALAAGREAGGLVQEIFDLIRLGRS